MTGRVGLRRTWPLRVAALIGLLPGAVAGQSIAGVVRDEAGVPVSGAAVVAHRADVRAGRAVTDARGRYEVAVDSAGPILVRVERLGYGTAEASVQVGNQGVTALDLVVSTVPLPVTGVVAEVERGCRDPESPRVLAELWFEARDILEALTQPPPPGADTVPVLVVRRDLGPSGRVVHGESTDTVWSRSRAPMGATVPVADEALTFVEVVGDSAVYFAPDARTVLSDRFLATHCFGMSPAGLTFEPLAGQTAPDVRGVFELPSEGGTTAALEFEFTAHPWEVAADDIFGGRVFLERSTSGGWFVERWSMTVPRPLAVLSNLPIVERREWSAEVIELEPTQADDTPACAGIAGSWTLWPEESEVFSDALGRRTSFKPIRAVAAALEIAPSLSIRFNGGAAVLQPEELAPKRVPLGTGALTWTTGSDEMTLSAVCKGEDLVVQRARNDGFTSKEFHRLREGGQLLEIRREMDWPGLGRRIHFTQRYRRDPA